MGNHIPAKLSIFIVPKRPNVFCKLNRNRSSICQKLYFFLFKIKSKVNFGNEWFSINFSIYFLKRTRRDEFDIILIANVVKDVPHFPGLLLPANKPFTYCFICHSMTVSRENLLWNSVCCNYYRFRLVKFFKASFQHTIVLNILSTLTKFPICAVDVQFLFYVFYVVHFEFHGIRFC